MFKNKVMLITYPDSIGKNLKELKQFLDLIPEIVSSVHILPPYVSKVDRGFSPLTHTKIDSKFGSWRDIRNISKKYDLCLDLIANHISKDSKEFQDVVKKGVSSKYYNLFIDLDTLGEINTEDFKKIPIRKPKDPYIEVKTPEGIKKFWSSFTDNQIDLNYTNKITYEYFEKIIKFLASKNVKTLRLDALGYVTKEIGTRCFLNEPEFSKTLKWFKKECKKYDITILPEIHDHPKIQKKLSDQGVYSYAFALPPLVLYTLLIRDSSYLKKYLREIPSPNVTILDTHDGICIPDVKGYLPNDAIKRIVRHVEKRGSTTMMRNVHFKEKEAYQLTCTFYDALNKDYFLYLCARAIQVFTPGVPQVYYVGLLAGENDWSRSKRYKDPREINRRKYTLNQAKKALEGILVQQLLKILEFRNTHSAFNGEFEVHKTRSDRLKLSWTKGKHYAVLLIDLKKRELEIEYTGRKYTIEKLCFNVDR